MCLCECEPQKVELYAFHQQEEKKRERERDDLVSSEGMMSLYLHVCVLAMVTVVSSGQSPH